MRTTFSQLTDAEIAAIRAMYYNGELRLQRFVNPKTYELVDNWVYFPLMKILKEIHFRPHGDYLIADEMNEAKRVSAALKNRAGYAPVVVGVFVDGVIHYFKDGKHIYEHAPEGVHIVTGPPEPLIEKEKIEAITIPDEMFLLEDGAISQSAKAKIRNLHKSK
jgi:hypothetical protein